MNLRSSLPLLSLSLLVLGVFVATCGGEGEPTLEGYFQKVEALRLGGEGRLADVQPPMEVEAAHRDAVDALANIASQLEAVQAQMSGAGSSFEADALAKAAEPSIQAAFDRYNAACIALQRIADDNNIEVDVCDE